MPRLTDRYLSEVVRHLPEGQRGDISEEIAATKELLGFDPKKSFAVEKAVLDHTRSAAVHDSLRYVAAWNSAFLPSADLQEAFTAFAEKRPPRFS